MTLPGPPAPASRSTATLVGVGIGLRWEMLDELFAWLDDGERAAAAKLSDEIPFFEVSPENYMRRGGYIPESLERIAAEVPLISHGLAMDVGGVAPFRDSYFAELKRFVERFDSPWHSDHLCFGGADGRALHDLLPLPHTREAATHVARRVREARDRLACDFAIENISYYAQLGAAEMSEVEFVGEVAEQADCGLLLDINNVYVNSLNHGFDAQAWLDQLDLRRVRQLHVAGHEYRPADELFVDTHGASVCDPVMGLLTSTIGKIGPVAVILERDNNVPPLATLLAERRALQVAYDAGIAHYRGQVT